MGNTNAIPVVSQLKSAVLAANGDLEGARNVQMDFVHECPIASQITSAVYAAQGDNEKALDTQIRCGKSMAEAADKIPVVGHIKGGIHYACGDQEAGNKSTMLASRSTIVVGAAIGGGVAGMVAGPIGAITGGIAAGSAVDLAMDSADRHDRSPPSD